MLYLILFLPLLGSFISAFFYKKIGDRTCQIITSAFVVTGAILSSIILLETIKTGKVYEYPILNWITSGSLKLHWSIYVDSLTAVMLVVVNSVSALVHIYSIGYMSHDPHKPRFMSYLSLFTFMMLSLITADNFLQLFFGWEGVGVASYLLIGFWFKKQSANVASMKAFIANRVGDFGLIFAIALIYLNFGTLDYSQVFDSASQHLDDKFNFAGFELVTIDWICILLFIGAMGKSAQIGLHVWLADAMEGPTPVSALIHAATMVTAGVFLVIRCSPLFELSPIALNFVTIIGALTAFFSATIALTQNDIKKIIAYSTCSQLGYMFFACGVSAYSPAIFHLATHAFFKALLFLSAGSVIHAMHHEQDIRKMGGIYKKIPFTYAMMWIGSLALAGFFPFAGYYSKDTILESAFMSHAPFAKLAFGLGLASAFLTAFYSWRLLFLTFHGKTRANHHDFNHAHESPILMLIPLLILGIGSIIAGYFGVHYFNMISSENNFFADSIFIAEKNSELLSEIHHTPILIKFLPMILSAIAIILAYWFYVRNINLPKKLATNFVSLYKFSFNKWYFDELYEVIFIKPMRSLGNFLWRIIDVKFVDGIPNGLALICKFASQGISKVQTGFIYNYALWMVLGIVGILSLLVLTLKTLGTNP